ncbi:MAG: MBL fold metallo-hydrolase [Deltaproteobacteria bacterium]|nr:MAG: MBL fold metallo-hydrolase [Deltaproteobacteria bacterium]
MIVKQIPIGSMENFSYLIADPATRTCGVIDPAFSPKKLLNIADAEGLSITHIINTHSHPDHTSGNAEIKAATKALILIHEADGGNLGKLFNNAGALLFGGKSSPPPDRLLTHGETIAIGAVSLTVLHTPGHTKGSICLYGSGNVFTGDTLFVGAVGRTDFPGGSLTTLIRSVHEQIYTLPGDTIVWPGHDYGETPTSTVRREIETNLFTR